MNVLYFGDVFSKPGRLAVRMAIAKLTASHAIDYIVACGENMTHGNGITPEMANEFYALGVDVITTGNHVWDQKSIFPFIEVTPWLIRPANFPNHPKFKNPGSGVVTVRSRRRPECAPLTVIQVMGRVFMDGTECPFLAADALIESLNSRGEKAILIDFHGEASSEKQAFAHFVDGRVSAVVGSHSHVQTADERVLSGGTAAITDVGMCGCFDSVIGVKKEASIEKFLTKRKVKYEPAVGPGGYGAVIVDIDEISGKARSILRLREVNITDAIAQ